MTLSKASEYFAVNHVILHSSFIFGSLSSEHQLTSPKALQVFRTKSCNSEKSFAIRNVIYFSSLLAATTMGIRSWKVAMDCFCSNEIRCLNWAVVEKNMIYFIVLICSFCIIILGSYMGYKTDTSSSHGSTDCCL